MFYLRLYCNFNDEAKIRIPLGWVNIVSITHHSGNKKIHFIGVIRKK